ncbi:3-deoxy-D-manno-octulosonic acid kinase [Vibrio renipiscarius]|uniref:3-deoxy-D-manno-octulosonic acid kinase n=2 Tax=Vibrio renipiscarius TaxID=1461322 RepID=A0A0C2NP00_9VIBR|nr:3-deoxy-D-manno-octulosonic acid kinase [Vibrio renipiscarius]KII81201.1 3-deoxy-D-manno-octulosonic acid kinase [Vibrio renipiscarius]KII81618.1 3-deoxy-D-manno-octulosonic acid kinase [Vibrio renipiscarius]
MMQTLKFDNQVVWFDESLIAEEQVKQAFDASYWQDQDKVVGSATGRGTTWFIQLDSMQGALRHYRRGGLFGKLVKDHYWFSGWDKTRSAAEFSLLFSLREAGVNVPKPIAARAVKSGLTYQADLLSERIPEARDLVSILQEKPLPAEIYQRIGLEIRKMHDAGVNHTDLNIHNILLDQQDNVWVIDFDKCHQQEGDTWKQANWDRLKRSFEKELKTKEIHWKQSDWLWLASK